MTTEKWSKFSDLSAVHVTTRYGGTVSQTLYCEQGFFKNIMPGNPPATDGLEETTVVSDLENISRGSGRRRYCKKCKFSCTDAREFSAHNSIHCDSDGSDTDPATSSSHASAVRKASRKVFRPKRRSKGSNLDHATTKTIMESLKDKNSEFISSMEVQESTKDLTSAAATTHCVNGTDQAVVGNSNPQSSKPQIRSSQCGTKDETDKGGDEPDGMTTVLSPENTSSIHASLDSTTIPTDIADHISSDEDMDDDRLIIDDGKSAASTGSRINRVYSCRQCQMTTKSAKSYLHHFNNDHKTDVTIFECELCEYASLSGQKLIKHQKRHYLLDEADQVNPLFVCGDKFALKKLDESQNSSKQNSSFALEETDDMEEDNCSDTPAADKVSTPIPFTITAENIDQVLDEDKKKKKKTRQEVDPGKYFEAVDSSGTKYACSQCGNIYKWRKSLNKHWKEKHNLDPLAEVASPPGMLELLKSGKYTQLGARRIYDKTFLATIKTSKNDDPTCGVSSPGRLVHSPSPPNFLNKPKTMTISASSVASPNVPLIPKMIGPFVSNTAQPIFPGMPVTFSLNNTGYCSPDEESALDLTQDSKPNSRNLSFAGMSVNNQDHNTPSDQDQPLDFSKGRKSTETAAKEKTWDEITNIKTVHAHNQLTAKQHHCPKCDFICSSEAEFANHTSSHLNKRIVRCYECKLQINSMDELNSHFIKLHYQKLTEYKEAIKKIPHGLQQTYHILNMEIHDIGELGSQDLGTSEGKSLKCKKCDFEAKWPAELQKHAVSHSEERPYICMVCGSTYKWKWDLVKHFQKSHPNLPNPYRRNDRKDTPDGSSEDEDEPVTKRMKFDSSTDLLNGGFYNRDDTITVEGIIAASQAGQRLISSQPNILDDEPALERNLTFLKAFPYTTAVEAAQMAQIVHAAQAAQEIDRRNKAQKAIQDAVRNRQNPSGSGGSNVGNNSCKKNVGREAVLASSSPSLGGSKSEELPYKCTMCNYHARWPSEVTQHMKNHSDSKPYLCPRCEYRSKWKWDVVKHLKRCGGGGINDVIDTTKSKKREGSISNGPPNAIVSQHGSVKKMTTQPQIAYTLPSVDENDQQISTATHHTNASSSDDLSRTESEASVQDLSNGSITNNDYSSNDNINSNYAAYASSLPFANLNPLTPTPSASISAKGGVTPASCPASLAVPQQTSSSRYNSSGEVWNCPYCPFTTLSQAELKRHSGLHSDDKPFKCDVCHYSTRWACDLKKHRKSYNHFPKVNIMRDASDKMEKSQPRFRCSQCTIYFHTLQCLLEHRLAEHTGQESSQSSPAPPAEHEIDEARIKHPRKQMKQIQCPKCLFVCKSRQTMDKHLEEHDQLERSGIHCFYCSSLFKDKEALLDHITTHSAFNPKEWETFFMISDEEQHQLKINTKVIYNKYNDKSLYEDGEKMDSASRRPQSQQKDSENKKSTTDSTEARIQQILKEIPKQMVETPQRVSHLSKFLCEWCPAEFANLTSLYKHASQAHPIQLKEQDLSLIMSDQAHLPKLPSAQSKKPYIGEPIDILRQQVADKRNHHINEKHNERPTSSPVVQDLPNSITQDEKGARCYTCDKCSFSSYSPTAFQHHYELHGSKPNSQCWFCDYSVSSIGLLYQHMKISHTRKWKALSQDPKYSSQIERINLAFTGAAVHGNTTDSALEAGQAAVDLSSRAKTPHTDMIHDIEYVTKQQYMWSGIPVNIMPVGSAINFVCPHCSFHDASIAETCSHVVQSHRAMSKFTCKTCQFSDDNIHIMSDHCKKEHPLHERIVEVLDFRQINFSELQIVQLNALKEQMAHDLSRKTETGSDLKSTARPMTCPFCPFKCLATERMKTHISNHSRQARYQCHMCDFSSDSTTVVSEHAKVHETDYSLDHRSFVETKVMVKKESLDRKANENESKMIARVQPILESVEPVHTDQESSPRSKMNKRIRYRCAACPYQTTCRSNMVKHLRQHNNNKRYKCSKCSYGAARAVLLKNHLDSHETPTEDDGLYHDIFCDPSFPNENFENNENENGEADNDFEELEEDDDEEENSDETDEVDARAIADLEAKDILEAETAHKASILLHSGDGVDKQFCKQKCPYCPFIGTSEYEFHKHVCFHSTQGRFKCDHCSYSSDKLNLIIQHRRLHADEPGFSHNPAKADLRNVNLQVKTEMAGNEDVSKMGDPEDEKNEAGTNQFSCLHCPYKSTKKKPLDIHCNSHGIHKRYICDFCDWTADRMGLLYQHRRVHESEPDYNPTPEDKIFLNQEYDDGTSGEFEAKFMEVKNAEKAVKDGEQDTPLSPPFKLTVVKKSYPCVLCPYKTSSKTSYSVHKNMHDSASEFTCSECSYSCMHLGLLQQHLRLHSTADADTPSPTSSSDLRSLHSKQQPPDTDTAKQLCESATSATSKKESQRSVGHLESRTTDPELKCSQCPFTASSQSIFKEHLKGHASQDNLACPYCDFTAASRQIMFLHIQIHFPGTKLEPEALEQILEEHRNNNNNNSNTDNDDMSKYFLPQPGTTAEEDMKKKRVYVCQFCESEFEAKQLMIQHEKQHLVGSL